MLKWVSHNSIMVIIQVDCFVGSIILTIHPLPHAIGYLEYGLRSTSYDECKGS